MLKDKLFNSFGLSLTLHVVIISLVFVSVGTQLPAEKPLEINLHPDAPENQHTIRAGVIDGKAVEAAYKKQILAEKKRKEKIIAEQKKAERIKREAAEAKKAAELAKAQKLKAEAEAKKVAEEAKRIAVAKEKARQELIKKKEAEAKAAALKAKQEKLRAERESFIKTEVQRYVAEIAADIEENRIISSIFDGAMVCKIRIQLLPDGSILSASIVESSGNPAYDEMSQSAVYKSAPFEMPEDKEIYNKLRDIVLSFMNGEQNVS